MDLDPALYIFMKDDELKGMIAIHVDDFLLAGGHVFQQTVVKTLQKRIVLGKADKNKFSYVGWEITQEANAINANMTLRVSENISHSSRHIL